MVSNIGLDSTIVHLRDDKSLPGLGAHHKC